MTDKKKIKNELISDFKSREHLLECLVASCLVPGWAGYRSRTIYQKKYMDGGFTVNLPNLYPGPGIPEQRTTMSVRTVNFQKKMRTVRTSELLRTGRTKANTVRGSLSRTNT